MFDTTDGPHNEVIARFDELFERRCPTETPESAALVERICVASRRENRAAAARLTAIGELFALRLSRCGENEDWAVDTMDAVAAEVAASLHISQGLATSYLRYARAMRERLPQVGAVFAAGELDFRLFQTIVFRTDLITDPDILAAVDAELAVAAPRWPSMTRARLASQIDKIVARADADAVRKRRQAIEEREVWIADRLDGLSELYGTLLTTDAHALGKRLADLAATVCAADPRSREARRADALGALAAGADRLSCRCNRSDCPAAGKKPAGPVVIHVIAEQATLDRHGDAPGSLVGADGLIPPELLAELATTATLRPLIHPGDAPPEPGYRPSKALADHVRCRDLTCRFPGCDRPAIGCDVDHTIPYGDGGPTCAANLACLCRFHHLVKTFWGWRAQQLRDGTLIWTSRSGDTYITTAGSALLFPSLCAPTAEAVAKDVPDDRCGQRTARMPTRRRTRAQNRAARITAERQQNRKERLARRAEPTRLGTGEPRPDNYDDDDPPPF